MLIEQGKKALGTEVVVTSDAKEDEVDDGNGAWEEEDPTTQPVSPLQSPSGSLRVAKSPRILAPSTPFPPHSYSTSSLSSSPSQPITIRSAGLPITPSRTTRGISVDSNNRSTSSFQEDETAWGSPELRESMEQARARVLQKRGVHA